MRKLMAMFAICVVATSTQLWAFAGMGDLKFDGSLEVSGNSANNETDTGNAAPATNENDHRGRTATRVRLGVNTQVTEGVNGRIELVRDTRQYGTGATSVSTEEGLWKFQNAYVDILDLWGVSARLGRQYVGNAGDLVWNFSPTEDDSLTTSAIDGLLLQSRKWDFMNVDLFTGKASEDDAIANTDKDDAANAGDVNLTSIDLIFPKLVPGGKINLGYLRGDDANTAVATDDNHLQTYRLGINGGVAENVLTYRAEFLQNAGQFDQAGLDGSGNPADLKYKGNAIDLGVGFNSKETKVGTFGAWLNWTRASGDNNATNDEDKSFHDFSVMGVNSSDRLFGEIFGKSNTLGGGTPLGRGLDSTNGGSTEGQGLSVFNIGAHMKPTFSQKSTFRVDWFMLARAEDSVKTGPSTTTNVGDKFGNELDLAYLYDHSANVGMEFGYAMLMPDDALKVQNGFATTAKDETITKWYARAKIKWGGEAQ